MIVVTSDAKQQILLVSYWLPPAVGAAAERMAGFARHLPRHGLDVHVLTAAHHSTGAVEPDDAVADAGVTVHRVDDPLAGAGPVFADYDPRQAPPLWKRIAREVVFPDRFARWAKAAEAVGAAVLREQRFALILASFPPASAARLGLRLATTAGVPLGLDFRDLWFGPGGYEPRSPLARSRLERLYRACISASKALVAVSDAMADALAAEHRFDRSRVFVIPNGYEPADPSPRSRNGEAIEYAGAAPRPDVTGSAPTAGSDSSPGAGGRAITIAHVGTVIARNRPDVFLQSVKALADAGELKGVRFRFVGNLSRDYVTSLCLGGVVETTGLVDRATAHREMEQADALLLLVGEYVGRWGHNAKLFEYVQTGRPILCIEEAEGSNDRRLLERFVADRTFTAPMGDAQALLKTLTQLVAYIQSRPIAAMELDGAFRSYNRASLTEQLVAGMAGVGLLPS